MLVAISGSIGNGKDTVAQMFNDYSVVKWENKKFAGKLKQIVSLLTGCFLDDLEKEEFKNSNLPSEWDVDGKPQTYRGLLQKLGTELLREGVHKNVHINALFADYNIQLKWILTDLRFENEFDAVKEKGGITIRVERYMTGNQWIDKLGLTDIIYFTDTNLISKTEFIEHLVKINYKNDEFFKKHLHASEIGLNEYYKQGKFDYVIKNDSTLEELQQKIIELTDKIEAIFNL